MACWIGLQIFEVFFKKALKTQAFDGFFIFNQKNLLKCLKNRL